MSTTMQPCHLCGRTQPCSPTCSAYGSNISRALHVFLYPSELSVLGRAWGPNVEVHEVRPI